MTLRTVYLLAAALIAGGFAVAYLVRSTAMARMVGIAIPSPSARADYRAIYGGAQLGIGIFLAAAALRPAWHEPGLWAAALFAGGFGVARLGSLAVDRRGPDFQWTVGAVEVLAGAAGVWLALGA